MKMTKAVKVRGHDRQRKAEKVNIVNDDDKRGKNDYLGGLYD